MGFENNQENKESNSLESLLIQAVDEAAMHIDVPEQFSNNPELYNKTVKEWLHSFFGVLIEQIQNQVTAYTETIRTEKRINREVYEQFLEIYAQYQNSDDLQNRLTEVINERDQLATHFLAERLNNIRKKSEELFVKKGVSEDTAKTIISALMRQNINPV